MKFEWNESQLETVDEKKLYDVVNLKDCMYISGMCEILSLIENNKHNSINKLVLMIKKRIEEETEACVSDK